MELKINENKTKENKEENFIIKIKKLNYNEDLYFNLDYNNINNIISECYFPLLQLFQSYDNFKSMMFDIADKLEIYFNNDSFFSLSQKTTEELEQFIDEEKIVELIDFSIIIFLLQYFIKSSNSNTNSTKDNSNDNNDNTTSEENIINIFQECY